ncbi:hypothetical protein V6N12_061914 [Hibiscus sabdariffa]|uniref:Uncharacterized protein n=1 Tax=Hibiscus sabdariffa TaxID=183260 RepID=A0ABR2DYF4_9ROSI
MTLNETVVCHECDNDVMLSMEGGMDPITRVDDMSIHSNLGQGTANIEWRSTIRSELFPKRSFFHLRKVGDVSLQLNLMYNSDGLVRMRRCSTGISPEIRQFDRSRNLRLSFPLSVQQGLVSTDGVQQASEPPAAVSADSDTNSISQPTVSDQTEPVVPGVVASHSDQPDTSTSSGLLTDQVVSAIHEQAGSEPLLSEPMVTDQVASIVQQSVVPTGLDQIDQAGLGASTVANNRHGMTIRSKAGIFRPKIYHAEGQIPPSSIKEAMKDPKWAAAAQEEYQALIKNRT